MMGLAEVALIVAILGVITFLIGLIGICFGHDKNKTKARVKVVLIGVVITVGGLWVCWNNLNFSAH